MGTPGPVRRYGNCAGARPYFHRTAAVAWTDPAARGEEPQSMNRNAQIGAVAAIVLVAAAALIYFFALGGQGGAPGGGSDAQARERATIFWKGLKGLPAATVKDGAAVSGSGKEALIMRDYEVTMDLSKLGQQKGKVVLRFGEINIRRFDWASQKAGKSPRWADMTMSNIVIPRDGLPAQALMGLSMVGVSDINIGVIYRYTYDEKTKTLDIGDMSFELKKLAAFSLKGRMINFDLNALSGTQYADPKTQNEAMQKALAAASVGRAVLVIFNKGLVEKIINTMATFRGGKPEAFKAGIIAQMEKALTTAPNNIARDAMTAAIAFMKNPKALTVEIAPEKPVPVSSLIGASPDEIREKLKLRFTAK